MAKKVLKITVDELLVEKLNRIAAETHIKKSYFANQALKEYFEEIDDYVLALQRKGGETITLKKAKEELEL